MKGFGRSVIRAGWRRGSATAVDGSRGSAFVFDIDGVLIRGGRVLDAGLRAMKMLHDEATGAPRCPVVFLTNGGGHSEQWRAETLSNQFEIAVEESQVILSHSPMRKLVESLNRPDGLVACVGKRQCADVARQSYGIRNAVAIEDLGRHDPSSTPYATYIDDPVPEKQHTLLEKKCSAILVMHDSRDWGRDIQLCCDLLRQSPKLQVIFSNPDFIFPNENAWPRFGQGAFKTALKAVYKEQFGQDLIYKSYGKPYPVQYRHCEEVLDAQLSKFPTLSEIDRIYAIGDNPAADVRGANAAGPHWSSVLVRTGVFQGGLNDEKDPADYVVNDAAEFVATKMGKADH